MPVIGTLLTAWLASCIGQVNEPGDDGSGSLADTGDTAVGTSATPETTLELRPADTLMVVVDVVLCEGDTLVVQTLGHADAVWADEASMEADPVDASDPWRTFRSAGRCGPQEIVAWRDGWVVDRWEAPWLP